MAYSDNVVSAESAGKPNEQSDTSTSSGPGGFLDTTWLETLRKHAPEIAAGKSDDELLALKTDPALNRQMVDAYAGANQAYLAKNGVPVTPGTSYLAHFAGPDGAVKVLQADPAAGVETLLSPAAIKANPFLKGMTAQGLQAWAAKKVGTTAPVPGPQPQAQPGAAGPGNSPPGAPLDLLAPQRPPIFVPPPPQAAQQPAGAPALGPAAFSQMPQAPPMVPIFIPPRKPLDQASMKDVKTVPLTDG